MNQENLIRAIQRKIGNKQSVIEEIAGVLDISYDAAHRRTSSKSKFSIDEAVLLCRHYRFSMDTLFHGSARIMVEKTKDIRQFQDLADYLESSVKALTSYTVDTATSLYYSAKDIPIFYTIHTDLLSRFKLYVWMYLLDADGLNMTFEHFRTASPAIAHSDKLKTYYNNVSVQEIWNDTTINSTVQQVLYFYESGLMSLEIASQLFDALTDFVDTLEERCTAKNEQYRIYYHDLLILNNTVLVADAQKKSFFVPYTMLGYFITEDAKTCQTVYNFFQHQLKNSKLLNMAGTRDKKLFFNRMHQKIDYYKKQVLATPGLI